MNRAKQPHAEKRRFIKDPVWGEVEFFSWERELLDHPLVNRLHGIIQNSCTFTVCPSLKYSRFAHSIGALHTVTQLFVNIARNLRINAKCAADEDDKKRCRQSSAQFVAEVEIIQKKFGQMKTTRPRLDKVKDVLCRAFPINREDALALAIVRIGALLHDLGHLPYSHLLENTIEAFTGFEDNDLKSVPASTRALHKKLNELAEEFQKRHRRLDKFHEWLGFQFATMMANDPVLAQDEDVRAFLRRAIELARNVWSREMFHDAAHDESHDGKHNLTPILSSLLSGDLDADRMDFVRRDSLFSWLFTCSVDFGRLFDLYEAGENTALDSHREKIGWVACPSSRSASDAAKLLIERFQLYKYAIAHHRVHLADELLERCLIELLRVGRLNQLLEDIIGVLGNAHRRAETTRGQNKQIALRRDILHLDDSWVNSQVRAWDIIPSGDASDLSKQERSVALFDAMLERRSQFRSVFKWDRDFNAWWTPNFAAGPFERALQAWLDKNHNSAPERSSASWPTFVNAVREDALLRCRGKIIRTMHKHRYALEEHLRQKAGVDAVIVGITARKVRGHMKSVEDARFFGLTAVNDYLTAATQETMVFNIWFIPSENADQERTDQERKSLLAESLTWVERELLTNAVFAPEAEKAWKEVTTK
ncbi:MAG TPA: hypothetical protein DCQ92_08025 [Verrucomicrobia subdivision 3 bacterium]|nr:hypothetical protein [Limisphaerales bacterium]